MSEAFVLEGEQTVRETDSRNPAIVWEDFGTLTTRGHEVYVNGSSAGGTYLSGSTTIVGNTVTAPLITFPAGSGGLTVVLESSATANSQAWSAAIVYRVLKPGASR